MNEMSRFDRYPSVAAAELVRNFAHWREIGARDPVTVTHHGRGTHMFVSMGHYRAILDAIDGIATDSGTEQMRWLATLLHQGVILCRADLTISFANPAALALAKRWERDLAGQMLWEALPEFAGTLTEAHIRHSLASGESSAADIPSPFRKDSWLHLESCPFAGGIVLLLRDITLDMQQHRLADAKGAIVRAIDLHGAIGTIRLSARGFIEDADPAFCRLIGLPQARLVDIALPDLIDIPARPALRRQMEQVLRGENDAALRTVLLTNLEGCLSVDAALVRLSGTYGTEGAVMIVTRAAAHISGAISP